MSTSPGTTFMADCPARTAIEVIANKWTVVTLYALADLQEAAAAQERPHGSR